MGPSTLAGPRGGADWSEAAKARAAAKARMPDHRCTQALAQLARRCAGADHARPRAGSRTNSTASELQRPATSMAGTTSWHR